MKILSQKKVYEVNDDVPRSYSMCFLFMFSGEADRTPLVSQQGGLDPETSMIGKATAGGEEEVILVSLCIICNLRVT